MMWLVGMGAMCSGNLQPPYNGILGHKNGVLRHENGYFCGDNFGGSID
jgi:hypothetical protein